MRDTVEMAREAGIELDLIDEDEGQVWYITAKTLKAFEALVRADERMTFAGLCNEMALDAAKEQLPAVSHALNVMAGKLREKAQAAKSKLKEKNT